MKHLMPALPYAQNALEPRMSAETVAFHYGKHLQTYVDNLNKLIVGTDYEEMPLEEIVRNASGTIFNNAAQVWNHTFFFNSLTPTSTAMSEEMAARLAENFGSVEEFKEKFSAAAIGLFGAGWAWLVTDKQGKLSIVAEQNAGNPLTHGLTPLLTIDVWEHAYYIDYRNRRADFVSAVWDLIDWVRVERRMHGTACNVYI